MIEYLPNVGAVGDEGNEAHLPVQTGAKAAHEGHCADVQGCLRWLDHVPARQPGANSGPAAERTPAAHRPKPGGAGLSRADSV